jgi:predicted nucleic-acid-binding Zn-ribbon protein
MKASKQCPKCDSLRIGYLPTLPDLGRSGIGQRSIGKELVDSVWASDQLHGTLEAYLCGDCGYFETYIQEVSKVPLEKLEGFRWINAETDGAGPFR